jgi:hypothetical protein
LISLFIVLALLPSVTAAESPEPNEATSRRGVDQLLLEEVRRIAARVETLRAERFVRPPFAVRVPEEMRDVAAEIRAFSVLPRDRVAARGRAWSDVGLGDADVARSVLLTLAGDLDGIGFDPKGNRLLVTPGRLNPDDFEPTDRENDPATVLMLTGMRPDEPLVGHLLMHVRQRERSGRDTLEETTDRLLATAAWAEGEANVIAAGYLFSGISVGQEVLPFLRSPGEVLEGGLLPPGLDQMTGVERDLIDFVYLVGFERAAERYRAGGWKALTEAAARRRTTSDLLHPERKPATDADFPAAPEPPQAGLQPVDVDSLGEQAIVALVSSLTKKDSLGLLAGEGWAGDRLYRWEDPDGPADEDGITEWITHWTSTEAAAGFDYAYSRALHARFPGRPLADAGDGSRTLITSDRIHRLERRGATVRVLVRPLGAPPASGKN